MTALAWPLNVPVLTDGTVTLRAHVPDDIDRMLQMAQDPDMVRWTAVPTPHTREMSEDFALRTIPRGWDEGTAMGWAIEFEGRYAGNVDIRGKDVLADIGYALHPDCRGHGVMTAAVRLAVDHAFVHAGKEVVQWGCHVGNVASLRVAWSCGFRLYGTQPDHLFERGRIVNAWTGAIHFGDAPTPRTRWDDTVLPIDGAVLRFPRESDLERWAEAESDEVTRHWSNEAAVTADDMRHAWHRRTWRQATDDGATWTIADADDRLLGQVLVEGLSRTAEIGYFMHPDARGRGLATAAVHAAAAHALDPSGLDLRRIELYAAAENAASLAVARAAGFTEFGRKTAAESVGDGTHADLVCFERLR